MSSRRFRFCSSSFHYYFGFQHINFSNCFYPFRNRPVLFLMSSDLNDFSPYFLLCNDDLDLFVYFPT